MHLINLSVIHFTFFPSGMLWGRESKSLGRPSVPARFQVSFRECSGSGQGLFQTKLRRLGGRFRLGSKGFEENDCFGVVERFRKVLENVAHIRRIANINLVCKILPSLSEISWRLFGALPTFGASHHAG